MTRTFIDEQTGERYTWLGADIPSRSIYGEDTLFGGLIPIIEPKLECNDWVRKPSDYGDDAYIIKYPYSWDIENLVEIRKANGEVFIKEDGQRKKK
jgi:hypothetical protein